MFISGEKLQELADLTIIFDDQQHNELWTEQIHNISCDYIVLSPGEDIPDVVFEANSIFVYTHALLLFFERIFPFLKKPVTLMSHNSDHGVYDIFEKYLNTDIIKKWFCQNRLISHPKLFSIPIGIANSQWPHGDQELFNTAVSANNKKEFLVYKNFDINTYPMERSICNDITERNGIPFSPFKSIPDYWDILSKSVFVISPSGGGVDCHRIWEALYLKTVPVVKYDECFSQYKHLPILFVDKWEDVTIQYLRDRVATFDIDWNIDELKLDYWKKLL